MDPASSNRPISRRQMLAAAAGAATAATCFAAQPPRRSFRSHYTIWDAHCHLSAEGNTPGERLRRLLQSADRLGIERVVVFMGYPFVRDPSPEQMRRQNDQVLEALEHAGGRALGFVYLNPKHTEASLREMDRCVRHGPMVGVKLWVALKCDDPRLDPIVQRAAQLRIPVLQHTWFKVTGMLPGESTPEELARLAARHPQACFIAAHAGGDWERGIRAIRSVPNVLADTCGSDPTAGMVEMAVRELGAERVVYGSDAAGRSFASQLAKVLGAEITEEAKRLILSGNLRRLLKPALAAKGVAL